MINRYFTPEKYNENGFMGYIAGAEDWWSLEYE